MPKGGIGGKALIGLAGLLFGILMNEYYRNENG
jgi:hypothetical protein